jgi:hypothetical protein
MANMQEMQGEFQTLFPANGNSVTYYDTVYSFHSKADKYQIAKDVMH